VDRRGGGAAGTSREIAQEIAEASDRRVAVVAIAQIAAVVVTRA
jgi:hypothetical protein